LKTSLQWKWIADDVFKVFSPPWDGIALVSQPSGLYVILNRAPRIEPEDSENAYKTRVFRMFATPQVNVNHMQLARMG